MTLNHCHNYPSNHLFIQALEKEMNVKSIILDEVQDLLFSSKDLVEFAEVAAKKVWFYFYALLSE